MIDDADDLDRGLALRFQEGGRREDPEDHPSPEKLSAYQAKELPPEESDRIQEHLVQCGFCTDLVLDLQGFLEPQEEEPARKGVADLGTEAGWRKLKDEMKWTGRTEEVSRLKRTVRQLQALAAVLLVGALGASLFSWRVLQEMKAPRVNSISAFVTSNQGLRATEVEPKLIELPRGEETSLTLSLDSDGIAEYSEYRAEIRRRRAPDVLIVLPGLRKQDDSFTFTMSSKELDARSLQN